MGKSPRLRVIKSFANTKKEIHYIVMSLAIGFLIGVEYCRRYL